MKRNMACILMLFSIVLINYSLKAYAEDTKPIYGSQFIKSYEGKDIKELIEFLGKPYGDKEKIYQSKPGFKVIIYIWKWFEIDQLPVKIIHDRKEGTTQYYVDYIKVRTEGGEITAIKLKHRNKFLIP